MTTYRPSTGDVLAAVDVLTDIQDLSDAVTADEAVDYRIAIEAVIAKAKETVDLLNMQLIKVLKGDLIRDGKRYYIGRKAERKRFDHDAICGHIIRWAVAADEEGEEPNVDETARNAVHAMRNIYISDSTSAKVGQLDRYNIPRNENREGSVLEVLRGDPEVKAVPERF